jgi:hypothetical protein
MVAIALATPEARSDPKLREAMEALVVQLQREAPNGLVIVSPSLMARALRGCRLSLPVAAQRKLEALALREEKRSLIAAEQERGLTDLIHAAAIEVTPLRGLSLARNHYPEPLARHCHALRWLVPDGSAANRLAELIGVQGWDWQSPSPLLAPHKLVFEGPGKINVELHRRPFPWTKQLPDRAQLNQIEFALAEIIGSALVEGRAAAGQWVVDVAQMIRTCRIDEERFAAITQRFGFSRWGQEALEIVSRLASDHEQGLQARIEALHDALGDGRMRRLDVRQVRDLRALQSLAAVPRGQFLARGLQRPDLLLRASLLRRHRRLRRQHDAQLRSALRRRSDIKS